MSRSVLRAIIGAAVVVLLAAFYLNGSRDVRRREGVPERVTGALEPKTERAAPAPSGRGGLTLTVPQRIDGGTDD